MMNNQLYQQEILEHYRHPQNFGRLKKPTLQSKKINELCGDEITIQLRLNKKEKIVGVRFQGSGCALSIASASLFTESLKGKTLAQIKKIKPKQVLKSLGVRIGPARKKCVLLPYDALQKALSGNK